MTRLNEQYFYKLLRYTDVTSFVTFLSVFHLLTHFVRVKFYSSRRPSIFFMTRVLTFFYRPLFVSLSFYHIVSLLLDVKERENSGFIFRYTTFVTQRYNGSQGLLLISRFLHENRHLNLFSYLRSTESTTGSASGSFINGSAVDVPVPFFVVSTGVFCKPGDIL